MNGCARSALPGEPPVRRHVNTRGRGRARPAARPCRRCGRRPRPGSASTGTRNTTGTRQPGSERCRAWLIRRVHAPAWRDTPSASSTPVRSCINGRAAGPVPTLSRCASALSISSGAIQRLGRAPPAAFCSSTRPSLSSCSSKVVLCSVTKSAGFTTCGSAYAAWRMRSKRCLSMCGGTRFAWRGSGRFRASAGRVGGALEGVAVMKRAECAEDSNRSLPIIAQ